MTAIRAEGCIEITLKNINPKGKGVSFPGKWKQSKELIHIDCPWESAGITDGTAGYGAGGQERSSLPEAEWRAWLPATSLAVRAPPVRAYAAAPRMAVLCSGVDLY